MGVSIKQKRCWKKHINKLVLNSEKDKKSDIEIAEKM
jgi:hypothetical protein